VTKSSNVETASQTVSLAAADQTAVGQPGSVASTVVAGVAVLCSVESAGCEAGEKAAMTDAMKSPA
jgi:hypothetical protein